MFTVLQDSALLLMIVLPLIGRQKKTKNGKLNFGEWAVNKNGKLESLSGKETDPNIIK
jgi:hypothetical protein